MAQNEMGARQAYSLIKRAYAKKGRNPVTTASTLRLQLPVASNKTLYQFPILQGDEQTSYPEQILLNRADAFTATEVGLFIGGYTDAAAATTAQDYGLYSYGATPIATALTNTNVLFYNSKLNVAVNNVQYLQNFDTFRFYQAGVAQTQKIMATGGTTGTKDSVDGASYGFSPLVPTLQFSGSSKIDIQVQLPSPLAASAGIMVLIFRGFLSLGASNLNK
jgi:hypothetical protein